MYILNSDYHPKGCGLSPCKVWKLLPQADSLQESQDYLCRVPTVEFINERMRELSKKPLPIWPIVLSVYVTCPLLLFVVIPASIDLYWLRLGPQVPSSLLTDSPEEGVEKESKRFSLAACWNILASKHCLCIWQVTVQHV